MELWVLGEDVGENDLENGGVQLGFRLEAELTAAMAMVRGFALTLGAWAQMERREAGKRAGWVYEGERRLPRAAQVRQRRLAASGGEGRCGRGADGTRVLCGDSTR